MSLNDESLLSAFLDGELDEPTRQQVESAVRSDPRLARKLREMMQVRDLVAGLSRPGSSEWTCAQVMAEIAAHETPRPMWQRRPARLFALGVGLAAAAGIWGVLGPRPSVAPPGGNIAGPAPRANAGEAEPESPPVLAEVRPSVPTERVEPPAPPDEGPVTSAETPSEPASLVAAEEVDPSIEARLRAFEHELAGLPEVSRLVFDLPRGGPVGVRSLEELVATLPRMDPRYVRRDLPAADGADGHVLFVFRVDAVERRKLMEELRRAFGRSIEPTSRPEAAEWSSEAASPSVASLKKGVLAPPRVEVDTSILATKDMEEPMPGVPPRRPMPAEAPARPAPRPSMVLLRLPVSE